jgi:hypothetical protein
VNDGNLVDELQVLHGLVETGQGSARDLR